MARHFAPAIIIGVLAYSCAWHAEAAGGDPMTSSIATLASKDVGGRAERLAALHALHDLLDNQGRALELHALGGIAPLLEHLGSAHDDEVRGAAARVLATAAYASPAFVARLAGEHPGISAQLLAVSQLPNEGAAAHGLSALGAVVRRSGEARAAFLSVSGLEHLNVAASLPGAAGPRARAKALTLLSDLLELAYSSSNVEGGSPADAVERLAASVVPQYVAAALRLLTDAGGLRTKETALYALRTALLRRPEDACAASAGEGPGNAAAVLRRVLRELGYIPDGAGGVEPAPGECSADGPCTAGGGGGGTGAAASESSGGGGGGDDMHETAAEEAEEGRAERERAAATSADEETLTRYVAEVAGEVLSLVEECSDGGCDAGDSDDGGEE